LAEVGLLDFLMELCKSFFRKQVFFTFYYLTKLPKLPVHILVNQLDLQQLLQLHLTNIRALCLVSDVVLHTNEENFAKNKFVARSTAGHDCLFGIVTSTAAVGSAEINQKPDKINTKKLKKLEQDLEKLLKTVDNEGYAERASVEVQRRHAEKISKVRLEIDNIRKMAL
jgi:valyl-tRNA synthetase